MKDFTKKGILEQKMLEAKGTQDFDEVRKLQKQIQKLA